MYCTINARYFNCYQQLPKPLLSTMNLPLTPYPPRAILPAVNYYVTAITSMQLALVPAYFPFLYHSCRRKTTFLISFLFFIILGYSIGILAESFGPTRHNILCIDSSIEGDIPLLACPPLTCALYYNS